MWRWHKAKGWGGNGSVQLGNDLSRASGLRVQVGTAGPDPVLGTAPQKRCSQTLLLSGHLPVLLHSSGGTAGQQLTETKL